MKVLQDLIDKRIQEMPSLELRSYNKTIKEQDQRCCTKCRKTYTGIKENYHIKKYDNGNIIYDSQCKHCKKIYNSELTKVYRDNPEQFIRSRFAAYKCRAKEINVPFNLTPEFLNELWIKQKGICYYTHNVIDFNFISESQKHPHLLTPSLDRLNPIAGYVIGNVVWCSYKVNRMKNDIPYEEFISLCNIITEKEKTL